MADIATVEEFASFLQRDLDTATANLVLLDLAQGLVTDEIGAQDPWPTTAKAVALSSAQRAYNNPDAVKRNTTGGITDEFLADEAGVYLTEGELKRLRRWLTRHDGTGAPTYNFPGTWPYPDPVERDADVASG